MKNDIPPSIVTGKNLLGPREYLGRLIDIVEAWVPSQVSEKKPVILYSGFIFEREMRNSLIICGNPKRQLWMLPVAFRSKKSWQLPMQPIKKNKGRHNKPLASKCKP